MAKSLLDTDMFSEILKGINQSIVTKAADYRAAFGFYTLSVITVMEIITGFHKLQREDRITEFQTQLRNAEILPFDRPCSELAGRIYADLERTGQPIGRADPMIAAIAIHYNLNLVTGNTAHYERIRQLDYELKLDNWR